MKNDEINYIQNYMLKSGEQLDFSINEYSFIDVKIIKRTERTFRLTGLLTLSQINSEELETVDEDILKLSLTPMKKLKLEDHHPNTIKWFEQGWIMKEIRFKKDGKTPDSQSYRMGFRLYCYFQEQLRAKEEKLEKEFFNWKNNSLMLSELYPKFKQERRNRAIQVCQAFIHELCGLQLANLKDYFSATWPVSKKLKFLHFISAFMELCLQKEEFDWKEIGALYYKEIGGSKQFDAYKEEFLDQLESITQCPAALMGMISLGKITPLYFSGQITGQYSAYQYGTVHALTDLSISEENYATNALNIWLVENRAVLTRMAAEKGFLKENHSLVICVDGHVRSSHRLCIEQLLKNSSVEQVLVWSDYDPDGLQIAKELYNVISPQLPIKWITADGETMKSWEKYENYMQAFLKNNRMEQEEVLGGAAEWKKWIHH
ncbi:DUF2399 domain-containing protein [Neobacillus pocheonensis]|uniref:DUF7281 domain-containing protein n=1 Tax=Neobacillus pocheonensis TaxID=363869 RepID=UPI003D2B82AF